ncbi:Smr/MutS family protein [bacterium]|nr:Smr/MutS family protein [bacterium]
MSKDKISDCNPTGPVHIPITDSLDLHTFQPKEVKMLLEDYLEECHRLGFSEVRIIHGKGTGTLRQIVHSALKRSSLVKSFHTATPDAGSWGATIVKLCSSDD